MFELPQVTVIALTGTKFDDHKRALDLMCKDIKFGGAKIIWDAKINSVDYWNHAIVYGLWKYVDTDFAFLFHADGYIINPDLWNSEWLNYDWCSSPWPLPQFDDLISYRDPFGKIQRVGNSVGLRSRKLLKLPTELGLEFKDYNGNTNEDGKFCVEWRHILEAHGCIFMPFEEAIYFGKEASLPENEGVDTFCFHKWG